MIRMAQPSHPGRFVRKEVIEPFGSPSPTPPRCSALVNGRAALSSAMALRIEKSFGLRMDTFLRMQAAFEIAKAMKRQGEIKVSRYIVKNPKPRTGGAQRSPSPSVRAFSR